MSYERVFVLDVTQDTSKHGLSLHCSLRNKNGAEVSVFHENIHELIPGLYQIYLQTVPDDFRGTMLVFHEDDLGETSSSSSEDSGFTYLAAFAINPEECEYVKNLYHCEIDYVVDDAAALDRWTVAFFVNGVYITDANRVTAANIWVLEETGGYRIAGASLTHLGGVGIGFWVYYASGIFRGQPGENLSAFVQATIDGKTFIFPRIHGRDS